LRSINFISLFQGLKLISRRGNTISVSQESNCEPLRLILSNTETHENKDPVTNIAEGLKVIYVSSILEQSVIKKKLNSRSSIFPPSVCLTKIKKSLKTRTTVNFKIQSLIKLLMITWSSWPLPVAKFIVPNWGDKVVSGIGLSYIGWQAGTTSLCKSQLHMFPIKGL
jgi:hypothetical protein